MTKGVTVTYIDGTTETFPDAESAVARDGVLRVYSYPYYGKQQVDASIPLTSVKKWVGGDR